MGEIRRVAVDCIGRAVMFGSLAIGCVMIGFSFNPVSAFRTGALLTLTMALALIWKAMTAAPRIPNAPKSGSIWTRSRARRWPGATGVRYRHL